MRLPRDRARHPARAAPGPSPAHAERSRCASASAASICEVSLPPARANSADPPPRRRRSCRACAPAGWRRAPPVAAAMATLRPVGRAAEHHGAHPVVAQHGLGQRPQRVGLHVVPPGHHDAAVGRGRLGQALGLGLARLLAQPGQLLLGLALALQPFVRWRPAARRARCAAAPRPTAPAARARGRGRARRARSGRRSAACSSRWSPPRAA